MKLLKKISEAAAKMTLCIAAVLAFVVFIGCANYIDDSSASGRKTGGARAASKLSDLNRSVTVNIHMLYADSSKNWNIWAWAQADDDISYTTAGWPGDLAMEKETATGGWKYALKVDPAYGLGILFVGSSGSPQTADISIDKSRLTEGADLYFIYGDGTIYDTAAECTGMKSAAITSEDGNTVRVAIFGKSSAKETDFTVTDSKNTKLTVSKIEATDMSATLTLTGGNIANRPYTVQFGEETVSANISSALIDTLDLKYTGTDLGVTIANSKATFKMWAPSATSVNVLIYASADKVGTFKKATVEAQASGSCDEVELKGEPAKTEKMELDAATGVWTASGVDFGTNKYYKYEIENDGTTYYCSDIWANVASADSIASQIVSIDDTEAKPTDWENAYTNPFGASGSETKTQGDAVIYEMHIRDWSRAAVSDSTGKFLNVANSTDIMEHLKDLGVTHVQILPMFDYAQVNADQKYNWGYNPYHYNVPEGRYVTEGYTDGSLAVKEMRAMIKAFHDAGIAVIMDVVYNHTNGTKGGSLYDSTVPGYFYHTDASGNYINYSGCGNALNTDRTMVRKYVKESLVHWMRDYHINGFRFDLMGIHSEEAMTEFYNALAAIDKNVLVYGEPWTGSGDYPTGGAKEAVKVGETTGLGAFDDDFRNAIKGSDGYPTGLKAAQVQGTYSDSAILTGLKSGSTTRNKSGIPQLAIHYVECHDNFTLYDKLVYTLPENIKASQTADSSGTVATAFPTTAPTAEQLALIKKQDKLCAAYVLLAQGTPFINGGQEFLRTKKGDPDSYAADKKGGVTWTTKYGKNGTYVAATDIDDVNTVNLKMKETYSDVYYTYKALIALRKGHSAFRNDTAATAEKLAAGVTRYTVSDGTETFEVIFNATDSAASAVTVQGNAFGAALHDFDTKFGFTGKLVTLSETDGSVSIASSATTVSSVPAKSFVILQK